MSQRAREPGDQEAKEPRSQGVREAGVKGPGARGPGGQGAEVASSAGGFFSRPLSV